MKIQILMIKEPLNISIKRFQVFKQGPCAHAKVVCNTDNFEENFYEELTVDQYGTNYVCKGRCPIGTDGHGCEKCKLRFWGYTSFGCKSKNHVDINGHLSKYTFGLKKHSNVGLHFDSQNVNVRMWAPWRMHAMMLLESVTANTASREICVRFVLMDRFWNQMKMAWLPIHAIHLRTRVNKQYFVFRLTRFILRDSCYYF